MATLKAKVRWNSPKGNTSGVIQGYVSVAQAGIFAIVLTYERTFEAVEISKLESLGT